MSETFLSKSNKTLLRDIEKNLMLMDFEKEKESPDPKEFTSSASDCLKKMDKLSVAVRAGIKESGVAFPSAELKDLSEISARVKNEEDRIKIIFNRLPLPRVNGLAVSDRCNKPFQDALREALDGREIAFKEKCVIAFILYYKEGKQTHDIDNYDLKGITDWITAYFFPDDSPTFVSEYITGLPTEKEEHLEIEIFPVSKLNGILL